MHKRVELKTEEKQKRATRAVDDTLNEILGETAKNMIYQYLETRGMKKEEIPSKMEEFRTRMQEILGSAADAVCEMVKQSIERSCD